MLRSPKQIFNVVVSLHMISSKTEFSSLIMPEKFVKLYLLSIVDMLSLIKNYIVWNNHMSPTWQKRTAFVDIPHTGKHKAPMTKLFIINTHLSSKESEDITPLSSPEQAKS